MRGKLLLASALAFGMLASPVSAAPFVVEAQANSSTGGTALNTGVFLTAGNLFSISSSLEDLWNAGSLPRWSDANGLVADRFATGTDESGQAAGTLIGQNFGLHNQDGFSAAYGSLVGRIGGVYQQLGANFSGQAWATGELELLYWDSVSPDNTGSIAFDISAIPEPATWGLMLLGFAGIAGAIRGSQRRRASAIGTVKFA